MPKRKMTPARRRQIALWQQKGSQSRKAKSRNVIPRSEYSGKMLTLYHRTSLSSAKSIARQGFKVWPQTRSFGGGPYIEGVYASSFKVGQANGFGPGIVKFKANRHKARLDDEFPSGEKHYEIDPKNIKRSSIKVLSGKKIRRRK